MLNRHRGRHELLCARVSSGHGLVRRDVVEKRCSRDVEQATRDRRAEVENAIVIAGRSADEHVLQHLFDSPGRAAVTNEIGSELAVAGAAEWHVVAQDFDFPAVLFDDGEGIMGGGRLDRVVEFDVGNFCPTYDFFLSFSSELVPGVEIVKILLDDYVASAGESWILVPDEDGICGRAAYGIFGAVHKAEHIAFVEIAEAVNFVGYGYCIVEPSHDLHGELETEIHMLGADVKN